MTTADLTLHKDLLSYCQNQGATGLFPGFVCQQLPQEKSLAVQGNGKIEATLICGLDFGLFQVPSYWLLADDPTSASKILTALKQSKNESIYVNLEKQLQNALPPEAKITKDRHYCLQKPVTSASLHKSFEISHLYEESLSKIDVCPEFKSEIGPYKDFTPESDFFGLLESGKLVAMAEATVKSHGFASIQHVYTKSELRGKGHAKKIVQFLSHYLQEKNLKPTYLVSESNSPSIRVAESLGYELMDELLFAEV